MYTLSTANISEVLCFIAGIIVSYKDKLTFIQSIRRALKRSTYSLHWL